MSMIRRIVALAGAVALVSGSLAAAQAQAAAPLARPTFSVLYAFGNRVPAVGYPSVIPSGDGGYYGTNSYGGAFGAGMVYKLAADGSVTTLYNFTGGADGGYPAGLVTDAQGNLYGVTQGLLNFSSGVIYKLTPDGQQTVLHTFKSLTTGWGPTGQLTRDPDGNLYGATFEGGKKNCPNVASGTCGVVFKLAPDGSYSILHAFTGGGDGAFPGNLVRDRAGNLYGTTSDYADGVNPGSCQTLPSASCGTVFRIAPDGSYIRLHAFGGFANGLMPTAGLVGDAAGNLYGTTMSGGVNPDNLCPPHYPWDWYPGGCGVVFKLAPGGMYSVLYAFKGGSDGSLVYGGASSAGPQEGLYLNPQGGGLYGTAYTFLTNGTYCFNHRNCGLVFAIMPDGSKRTVYNFANSEDLEPIGTPLVKGQGAQLVGIAASSDSTITTVYSLQFEDAQ